MNIVDVAKMVKDGAPVVMRALSSAAAVVESANALAKKAGIDPGEVVDGAKDAAADVAVRAKDGVAEAAGGALRKVADARDRFVQNRVDAKAVRDAQRAIKEARQSALENATKTFPISELTSAREAAGPGPLNAMPGCFAIATYRRFDNGRDLTDYTGIYVGKAGDVATGLPRAISRDGDPDVYADVKYKQNVRVFVYYCMPEDVEQNYQSLVAIFGDDERLYA